MAVELHGCMCLCTLTNTSTPSGRAVKTTCCGDQGVFAAARACAPAVILIDELDALAPSRGNLGGGPALANASTAGSKASARIVSTLLEEMDGMSSGWLPLSMCLADVNDCLQSVSLKAAPATCRFPCVVRCRLVRKSEPARLVRLIYCPRRFPLALPS